MWFKDDYNIDDSDLVFENFKNLENLDFNYFENAIKDINAKYKATYYELEDMLYSQTIEEKMQILIDDDFFELFDQLYLRKAYAVMQGVVDLIDYQDKMEEEQEEQEEIDEIDFYINSRKHREFIKNSLKIRKFLIGDILEFVYKYKNMVLTFSGICISLRKKSFVMPDLSLILRNVIIGVGIELTISYFYNFGYKMLFLDYRRKFFHYNKNKLYFIRNRVNRESKV